MITEKEVGIEMTFREFGRHIVALRILWIVCLVVVIIGSLLPANSAALRALDKLDINDKVEHLLAYAALAFLPALHERRRYLIPVFFFAAALGVLLEFGQLYSPGRTFDVYDMLADGAGIVLGAIAGLPLRSSIDRRLNSANRAL